MNRFTSNLTFSTQDLIRVLQVIGGLTVAMWFLEGIDWITGNWIDFDVWGIRPRVLSALPSIIFAPFLHADFEHLFANTVPFVLLGALVFLRGERNFWIITAIVTLASGVGIWVLGGPNTVHIGASGVVFGFFGFLLFVAVYERSLLAIAQAVLVGALYGGLIFGVFPFQEGISWLGHLFGFIGGIGAASLFRPNRPGELF